MKWYELVEHGDPWVQRAACGLGRVGQAKCLKVTVWAGTGSKSDGHGCPSTFLLNNVCRFYKKIACGTREFGLKLLYFSVLISFPMR